MPDGLAERGRSQPSTSRMSSTIWNARPTSAANAPIACTCASVPPAMSRAGHRRDADEAAGLARVHVAQRRRGPCDAQAAAARCRHARSIACPPTMPAGADGPAEFGDDAQLAGPHRRRRSRGAGPRQQARRPRPASRRQRESPAPRRSARAPSAGRGAACRRPSTAGRRARATACARTRPRRPPAGPATAPRHAGAASAPGVGVGHGIGGGQREQRPEALAAGADRVAHRLGERRRAGRRRAADAPPSAASTSRRRSATYARNA